MQDQGTTAVVGDLNRTEAFWGLCPKCKPQGVHSAPGNICLDCVHRGPLSTMEKVGVQTDAPVPNLVCVLISVTYQNSIISPTASLSSTICVGKKFSLSLSIFCFSFLIFGGPFYLSPKFSFAGHSYEIHNIDSPHIGNWLP